jgi:hypothetical protein
VYDGERADLRALEQLEAVLRELGEELATWRARALKAEPSRGGGGSGGGGGARASEVESENRQLRARLEAARTRVQELVTRLAFLEEQSREAGTTGGSTAR